MNTIDYSIADTRREIETRFRVLFVPGYRTKSVENYHARNTVLEACKVIPEFTCDTLTYPQEKIGRHSMLPCFSDMVGTAKSVYAGDTPTIIVGHCTGAAVAVALAQTVLHIPPAGILLLCPPVNLHPSTIERATAFRIFGVSTHIPKAAFVSEDYKKVLTGKATATWEAMSVFQRLSPERLALMSLSQLVFLSASEDTECNSNATERLANVLGCHHQQVSDNHSLKHELTINVIKSLLVYIKNNYDDLPLPPQDSLYRSDRPCDQALRAHMDHKVGGKTL